MKKTSKSQRRTRCQSIINNNTCMLTSILKKPSKFKLKHQRSVRFEEPGISCPTTFSLTSSIIEPFCASPNNELIQTSPSKSRLSSTSPITFSATGQPQFSSSLNEGFNPTPVKIIKIAQLGVNNGFKESPKSGQKVLKLDCRDDKFYNKLNFFLNTRNSVSPGRNREEIREGSVRVSRKKISFGKNRVYEDTANGKQIGLEAAGKKGNECKGGKSVRGSYLLN